MSLDRRPTVLFVCVHNAGRSQMAAAFLRRLAAGRVEALSGGTLPAEAVHPTVVQAMAEVGIDISRERPRSLAEAAVQRADVVVTMGCGDSCPFYPGKRYEDWEVEDPAGKDLGTVRRIRDEIEVRVRQLVRELSVAVD
ncbi:MAG TPA: arsenate reductase ArsC [Candidatus Dormibacteraeota bacterium]|nr:arsenate reductase ArsC [Candidatus Dormibacteraeota bacterium]